MKYALLLVSLFLFLFGPALPESQRAAAVIDHRLTEPKENRDAVYHQAPGEWPDLETVSEEIFPEWLTWLLALAVGLVILFSVTSVVLRIQVRARMAELYKKNQALQTEVAERKLAEEALLESEARNRALLGAIPDLILQLNKDGTYLDVMPSQDLEPVAAPEEMIGANVYEVLPVEVARQRVHCVEQALQTGELQVHEYRLEENGRRVNYEARIIAIDADKALAIVRDITERTRTEEEKTRLVERMQRQHATLVHLATHPALAEGRLDEALKIIAGAAAETLDVERVNIWRVSADSRELHCVEAFEHSSGERTIGLVFPISRYPRYFAALEAERVVEVADVVTDPRTVDLTADYWEPFDIGAAIDVPVRLHGQLFAKVCHEHVGAPRTWAPDEVTFANQVADLVTQAFLNADLRRWADELATITRVSREITSVPDLQRTLASIAHHAAQLSNSDASGVFAFRSDGRLYVEAAYGVQDEFVQAINAQGVPVGRGAIGRAAAKRRTVQIPDVLTEPNYSYGHLAVLENVRSILAVPMLRDEEMIGGIVMWRRDPRRFTSPEVAFLQALAQQCINAVENAHLFEAEARRRREAETLRAATLALSATLDLQRVFELILSELQKVVPYDSASVQQLIGDRLEIIGGHGFPNLEELIGVGFDLVSGDNPNRKVVRTRAPFILDDAPAVHGDFHREPHAQAGIRSWLGVPLLFRDRLIGMIALDKKEPGFYTQEHARLALAFAAQAAIAIENARLFAAEEQNASALASALETQQELDRLKDAFIQNVSHELRTPLGLIQGYAELLDFGELGELQPKQRDPVSIIARRARMLAKLVEDLTAILETETRKSKRERVDLADLVHNLLADFQVAIDQAGLTLEAEITPNLLPVFGDPMHLRRVLDNLLGNARKFTPAGGRITVRLGQDDEHLMLTVTDTGIGIPSDHLDHIFDRFYQVDGSMSRRYGGAGLGLALVKEIVEAHGGRVSVESQLGKGSTFRVSLPASPQ